MQCDDRSVIRNSLLLFIFCECHRFYGKQELCSIIFWKFVDLNKKKHILCVLTFRNWLQFKLEYLANSHVQLWNSHADCSWEQKFTKLKCKYTPNVNSSDNCRYCNTAPIKNFIIETDNTESTLKNSANTIIWKLFMAKIGLRTSAHLSKSDNINTLSASRLPKRS